MKLVCSSLRRPKHPQKTRHQVPGLPKYCSPIRTRLDIAYHLYHFLGLHYTLRGLLRA